MKAFIKKIVVSALVFEARLVIKKYKPRVVTITGSVGKTSTRDAVYAILASKFFTRKSDKSLPNDLIVPLTILGQPYSGNNPFIWLRTIVEGLLLVVFPYSYPAWLVLEVGADRPGDIQSIMSWLRPDVAVITSFGFGATPVHVEFFNSIDELILEKASTVHALADDGLFVFNHDDEKLTALAETISRRKISYGFGPGATVQALEVATMYGTYENSAIEFPQGVAFKAEASKRDAGVDGVGHTDGIVLSASIVGGFNLSLELVGALGHQHVAPVLAAMAVGLGQNLTGPEIDAALKTYVPPRGRMRLMPAIRGTVVIDDSYNASPVAVSAALNTLKDLKALGRKIAVLGDMLELGRYSIAAHRRMGEEAVKAADILVTVGIRSREAAEMALDKGLGENAVFQFDTSTEAGKYIAENILQEGDIVLVKGSQSMRMERCVEEIMEHREDKEKLLVRQDAFWLRRG